MHSLLRIADRFSGSIGLLAAWIVLPLIVATIYEVFSRYLFNAPTIWAYEIGYMMTGANFLLGSAFALREKAHIRIDVLYSRFSPRLQALVDTLGYTFLFLPLSFWLSYRLANYALGAFNSGQLSGESAWNPVIWPFRVVFFVGFLVLSIQAVAELIRAVRTLLNPTNIANLNSNG